MFSEMRVASTYLEPEPPILWLMADSCLGVFPRLEKNKTVAVSYSGAL